MHEIAGGYKTLSVIEVANAIFAYRSKAISLRAFRIYFAAAALAAVREAAARSGRVKGRDHIRYTVVELCKLVSCPEDRVRKELRKLERVGLLLFSQQEISLTRVPLPGSEEILEHLAGGRSPKRPIPFPRRILRIIANERKAATSATLIVYCVRGLTLTRDGLISCTGAAKASTIALVTGLSLRAVRCARRELITRCLILPDTHSSQRALNRVGAWFGIDVSTHGGEGGVIHRETPLSLPVGNSGGAESAPPQTQSSAQSAPPYRYRKTLSDLKNQKLAEREPAGFWGEERKPNLRNIQPGDLRKLSRVRDLYEQATAARWLERSEANFLNFAAAAVRANRAAGDPVRIFVGIVKKALWHHITCADEQRAAAALKSVEAKTVKSHTGCTHGVNKIGDSIRSLWPSV